MLPAKNSSTSHVASECLKHLRILPFVRRAETSSADGAAGDCQLAIETPERTYDLACRVMQSHLARETAQMIIHHSKTEPALVVMAPSVGRQLGELFEREGINFVDAAGNCNLQLDGRYYARVEGKRQQERPRSTGMRPPAYRVLLGLLVRPTLLEETSRTIASEVGVSPQTANDVRRRMRDQGVLLKVGRRHAWAPGRRKDAMALWLAGFTASLGPSLLIGRFRAAESDPVELEKRIEPALDAACEWRYGGGAAAMRLTDHYRGDRTVLYLGSHDSDLLHELRFVRDARGPILLAHVPGKPAFDSPHPQCVHPLLAYADLLAEGHDRAAEAAAELHERYLTASGRGDA